MPFVLAFKDFSVIHQYREEYKKVCRETLFSPGILQGEVETLVENYDKIGNQGDVALRVDTEELYYPMRTQIIQTLLYHTDRASIDWHLQFSKRRAILVLKQAVRRIPSLFHNLAQFRSNEGGAERHTKEVTFCSTCQIPLCLKGHGHICVTKLNRLLVGLSDVDLSVEGNDEDMDEEIEVDDSDATDYEDSDVDVEGEEEEPVRQEDSSSEDEVEE